MQGCQQRIKEEVFTIHLSHVTHLTGWTAQWINERMKPGRHRRGIQIRLTLVIVQCAPPILSRLSFHLLFDCLIPIMIISDSHLYLIHSLWSISLFFMSVFSRLIGWANEGGEFAALRRPINRKWKLIYMDCICAYVCVDCPLSLTLVCSLMVLILSCVSLFGKKKIVWLNPVWLITLSSTRRICPDPFLGSSLESAFCSELVIALVCAGVNFFVFNPQLNEVQEKLREEYGGFHLANQNDPLYERFTYLHETATMVFLTGMLMAFCLLICLSQFRDLATKKGGSVAVK